MAVVKLLPRKAASAQGREQSMEARLDYDANPDKTRGGKLVSSFMCQPETAAAEFEAAKVIYEAATGRSQPKDRDVTMYRVMQSFKPGEVTPERANKIGYELAMEFTKGQHQFVVYTHEDKSHIHNHIEINSTNLECNGKFKNVKDSVQVLRRINDRICLAHGLSIPEPKREKALSQGEKGAVQHGRSFKERLRHMIDSQLPGCNDFAEFLNRMRKEGYEVKHRGKSLEFRAPGQERFTRSFRLGEGYTEQRLRERIAEQHGRKAAGQGQFRIQSGGTRQKADRDHAGGGWKQGEAGRQQKTAGQAASGEKQQGAGRRVNLLVDIQAKLQAGKGRGYEQWAKVFNLKEAAKTVNFLTENGVTDYEDLEARAECAGQKFDSLSARIRQLEGRMADKARLKMHIINYAKTKDVYAAYKRAGNRDGFRKLHREEIEKHEAAKAAFNVLDGKKIPKVAELSREYAALLAEKKECYGEFKEARKEMIEYQTAKMNVDKILGMEEDVAGQGRKQGRGMKDEH